MRRFYLHLFRYVVVLALVAVNLLVAPQRLRSLRDVSEHDVQLRVCRGRELTVLHDIADVTLDLEARFPVLSAEANRVLTQQT